jgi:hypothetical protein
MDLDQVRLWLDCERRTGVLDGDEVEVLPLITRTHSADRSRRSVCFSALSEDNADENIAEQVGYFRSHPGEVEWKAYAHDTPPDLLQRLQRDGFDVGPHEAVLVLDLQTPPRWVHEPLAHRVVRVESLDQLPFFRGVAERVFNCDWSLISNELSRAIRSGSTDHVGYIAFDNDIPAAIGRLYTRSKSMFGGLYGGGTLTAHRKRGLYRALVAFRARDAAQFGVRYLLVDALPTSRPILESLGFCYLTGTWPCTLRKPVPIASSS